MNLVADEISRTSDRTESQLAVYPAKELLRPHMPALDVLRGLAILIVVIFHGMVYSVKFQWQNPIADALFQSTSAGWTGVNLFFVLSGFLITGNLMDSEKRDNYYSRFYIRRALRILPVYFAVLVLLLLTGRIGLPYAGVCLLFMANMPGIFFHGPFIAYGPLWSLAVEEQFYLGWPFIYRMLKRNGLIALCIALMIFCPLLRAAAIAKIIWLGDIFSKTWMVADNLAIGALVAAVLRSPRVTLGALKRSAVITFVASAAVLGLILAQGAPIKQTVIGGSIGFSMIEVFYASLMLLGLIWYRSRPLPPQLKFLVFFGDISYGLYLYHMFLTSVYDDLTHTAYNTNVLAFWMRFLIPNTMAVLLAVLSKKYFENPILHLKKHIPAAH